MTIIIELVVIGIVTKSLYAVPPPPDPHPPPPPPYPQPNPPPYPQPEPNPVPPEPQPNPISYHNNWQRIERGVYYFHPLDYALQIKTDSAENSNEEIDVIFFTNDNTMAGGFNLKFDEKSVKFSLIGCSEDTIIPYEKLPQSNGSLGTLVWKIGKNIDISEGMNPTTEDKVSFTVRCNDTVIMKQTKLTDACTRKYWKKTWGIQKVKNIVKILFDKKSDTASDFYLSPCMDYDIHCPGKDLKGVCVETWNKNCTIPADCINEYCAEKERKVEKCNRDEFPCQTEMCKPKSKRVECVSAGECKNSPGIKAIKTPVTECGKDQVGCEKCELEEICAPLYPNYRNGCRVEKCIEDCDEKEKEVEKCKKDEVPCQKCKSQSKQVECISAEECKNSTGIRAVMTPPPPGCDRSQVGCEKCDLEPVICVPRYTSNDCRVKECEVVCPGPPPRAIEFQAKERVVYCTKKKVKNGNCKIQWKITSNNKNDKIKAKNVNICKQRELKCKKKAKKIRKYFSRTIKVKDTKEFAMVGDGTKQKSGKFIAKLNLDGELYVTGESAIVEVIVGKKRRKKEEKTNGKSEKSSENASKVVKNVLEDLFDTKFLEENVEEVLKKLREAMRKLKNIFS